MASDEQLAAWAARSAAMQYWLNQGLSFRASNCLVNEGIQNLSWFYSRHVGEARTLLGRIPNCGKVTTNEIINLVVAFGALKASSLPPTTRSGWMEAGV